MRAATNEHRSFGAGGVDECAGRRLGQHAGNAGNGQNDPDLTLAAFPDGEEIDREIGAEPTVYIGEKEIDCVQRRSAS
jgi:hypothetical protein